MRKKGVGVILFALVVTLASRKTKEIKFRYFLFYSQRLNIHILAASEKYTSNAIGLISVILLRSRVIFRRCFMPLKA